MVRIIIFILSLVPLVYLQGRNHQPTTYLMPLVEFNLEPAPLGQLGTAAFSGEFGVKNVRTSTTFGAYATPSQRIKISGEYLGQDLRYHTLNSSKRKWINQLAIGGLYQFILPNDTRFMTLDFGISYSHAFNPRQKSDDFFHKKIVGSNDAFGFLGCSSEVWEGGYLTFRANYDYIRFDKRFKDDWRKIGGGWSLFLTQCLGRDFELTVGFDTHKPYKYYEASLDWNKTFTTWELTCGLYGSYTNGRAGIPNATAAGLQVSFAWGTCIERYTPSAWFNDLYPVRERFCDNETTDTATWLAQPAVRVPVVLATEEIYFRLW